MLIGELIETLNLIMKSGFPMGFKYPETSSAIVSELNLVIPSKKLVVFTGGSIQETTVFDLLINSANF